MPSTSTAASSGSTETPIVDARVAALVGECRHHHVGGAVHDLGAVEKGRHRTDEAAQPHDTADLVEIAERRLDLRQHIDGAGARGLLAVLDRDIGAELALGDELALGVEAELSGYDEQVAGPHKADIVGQRGGGRRQHNSEIGQLLLDDTCHFNSSCANAPHNGRILFAD